VRGSDAGKFVIPKAGFFIFILSFVLAVYWALLADLNIIEYGYGHYQPTWCSDALYVTGPAVLLFAFGAVCFCVSLQFSHQLISKDEVNG
jgi:hypothetical protein